MDSTVNAYSPVLEQQRSSPHLLPVNDTEGGPVTASSVNTEQSENQRADTPVGRSDTMDSHPVAATSTQSESRDETQAQVEDIGLSEQPQPEPQPLERTNPEEEAATLFIQDETLVHNPPEPDGASATQLDATPNSNETNPATEGQPNSSLEPKSDIPEWVLWEDDLSKPTEEELEAVKGTDTDMDATNVAVQEKSVFPDHDDPGQRPVKKIRLQWSIVGVRGTKQRPNRAQVMHSPAVLVDGLYWQIKFFPRGNKSTSLSAYIQCSKTRPNPDKEAVESSLAHYESAPEGNIGNDAEMKSFVKTEATPSIEVQQSSAQVSANPHNGAEANKETEGAAKEEEDEEETSLPEDEDDFRVSAQLGMVIYNPQEPRTGYCQSSEHLFCPTNNDWGWSQLVTGKWDEIHIRKTGQRQALLRDDKIVIDAYIRIFDDPSQSLFWHSSHEEPQWPSKTLAGCLPMGTPELYHSPAVAGITAWLFLKPFREVVQSVDCGGWRSSSRVRPRPFLARLKGVLHQMRHLKDTSYVNLHPTIEALREYGETHTDVLTFWETFRRAIELELEGENEMLQRIASIFDVAGKQNRHILPPLPVQSVGDIQTALGKVKLSEKQSWAQGPEFLPLLLQREEFNEMNREWNLQHEKVTLNEEVTLPFARDQKYSLYGFVVHVGARNSGRFYSIIRPHGPGTKWLAFEDGDGNKVFSYTRKMIESYEGLTGEELKDFSSTRETAYIAMYIRTDRLVDYLPGALEEYSVPAWLGRGVGCLDAPDDRHLWKEEICTDEPSLIDVEVYHDRSTVGQRGLLDMFNVKHSTIGLFQSFSLPASTSFQEVRRKIADNLDIDDPKTLKLFCIAYGEVGQYDNARWHSIQLHNKLGSWRGDSKPLCIWTSVLLTESDIELFADPDVSLSEQKGHDELKEVSDDNSHANTDEALPQSVEADAEDEMSLAVTHGHLIDAVAGIEQIVADAVEAQNVAAQQHATSAEDETAIAALIAADAAEMSASSSEDSSSTVEPPAVLDEQRREEDAELNSPPSSIGEPVQGTKKEPRDPAVYGFIQKFDVDEQNFVVHGTFFASRYDRVKETMRKRMEFGQDQDFKVWYRTTAIDGVVVKDSNDFQDINFVDGVDIIIGEVLSEDKVSSLRAAGQFWDPFELSQFLRRKARKHPLATTAAHVSITDFGQDRYEGPLVNGRRHGSSCSITHSNGQFYQGPLVCGARQGSNGHMTYQNGDTYVGDWQDNEQHGRGTRVQKRTGNKYEGSFQNGRPWGQGTTWWQVADEEGNQCQICYGEDIDALFFDCGHVCSCMACAKQCDVCPICRRTIKEVVKMYRV